MKPPNLESAARLAALLFLGVVAVYLPALGLGFVNFDDPDYVTRNPQVQAGLSWAGTLWAFTQAHAANWHPLTWWSHMLDCQFYGLRPAGHHLTSVLLHAANTALVFLLLRRITGAFWRSAIVAALFGLHPLHVESVAWVSERKDVLSAFFGLLCLWAYAAYAEARTRLAGAGADLQASEAGAEAGKGGLRGQARKQFLLAALFLGLGLLSKPMLVTWPCVMLLLDYWPLQRSQFAGGQLPGTPLRRLVLEKAPFFGMIVASGVVTLLVQKAGGAVASLDQLPLTQRLMNVPVAYCQYLGKIFWPAGLAVVYPLGGRSAEAPTLGALALLGAVTVLAIWQWRRRPYLLMGWAWFLGTLVPVIGLVQVGTQSFADRYMYLPSIGLFMALAWGAAELASRFDRRVMAVAGSGVVAACALLTVAQIRYWKTSETLFSHAVAVTENNFVAWDRLGMYFSDQREFPQAEQCFETALKMNPAYSYAWNNFGCLRNSQGRYAEAVTNFQHALRLSPDLAAAHASLGTALLNLQKPDEAIPEYLEALRLRPRYAEAHYNLANAFAAKGAFGEAESHYRAAIQADPGLADARNNLAFILARQGKLEPAVQEFRAALALQPGLWEARHGLCETLSAQGKLEEAARGFLELAQAHGDAGRFQQAAAAAVKAQELAQKARLDELARAAETQVRHWQARPGPAMN